MKRKQFISFVFVLHLLVVDAKAQSLSSFPLVYESTTPKIHQLLQVNSGYILAATSAGLFRFDGIAFHRLTHLTNTSIHVTAVYQLKDGKIWVGFADGHLGWLQHNKVILQYPEEGTPKVSINKIIEDKQGKVWIATAGEGLYCFFNNHFYNINTDDGLSDDYVYDISVDANGVVAVTDRGINIIQFDGSKKQVEKFTSADGLKDNIVTKITALDAHRFFIGMQDAGIGFFSISSNFKSCSYYSKWIYNEVTALLKTKTRLFAATGNNSIVTLPIDVANTLSNNSSTIQVNGKVSSLLQDKQGNLWAAVDHQLLRFGNEQLQYLFDIESNGNVHAVMVDKDNHVWYNVNQTIKHQQKNSDGTWSTQTYTLPISKQISITALYEDYQENVWVGTMGGGLWRLNPYTKQIRKITEDVLLKDASILSVSGKGNTVWIASLQGAVQCNLTESSKNISTPLQFKDFTASTGIGGNYIYSIFVDSKNRVWFATDGKGLTVWDGKNYLNYNQKNGLPDEVIYKVVEDSKGNLWFSTFKGGLIKFNGKVFKAITTKEGLSDINIAAISIDQSDNLYIPHSRGIDIFNTSNESFSYLNQQMGISNPVLDLHAVCSNQSGNIYFVSNNKIYTYSALFEIAPPKVVVDKFQLFLKDTLISSGAYFNYNENNISFHFTGIDYTQPQSINYQYQLVGYANGWINTKDGSVNFPQLPPGKYHFKIRASINNYFEQSPITEFVFVITKPFWLRWWFIGLIIIVVAGLLYLIIKSRERSIKKWESLEKEKIQSQFETLRNQVNPHFLFNSFNTLIAEIEDDPKQAVEYVEHLSDFYRSIVVYREKETIPLSEEFDLMKNYYYIQQKRYGDALVVINKVSKAEVDQYFIAPLTLQLLLENAVKHNAVSTETPLVVHIDIKDNWLTIENNLNLKLTKEKSSGLGLQNIAKRYLLLTNIAIRVESKSDSFAVSVPLISNSK